MEDTTPGLPILPDDVKAPLRDEQLIAQVQLTPEFTDDDGNRWWLLQVPAVTGQTQQWGAFLSERHVIELMLNMFHARRLTIESCNAREDHGVPIGFWLGAASRGDIQQPDAATVGALVALIEQCAEPTPTPFLDDWCADSTLSHALCTNGACECPCHAEQRPKESETH